MAICKVVVLNDSHRASPGFVTKSKGWVVCKATSYKGHSYVSDEGEAPEFFLEDNKGNFNNSFSCNAIRYMEPGRFVYVLPWLFSAVNLNAFCFPMLVI